MTEQPGPWERVLSRPEQDAEVEADIRRFRSDFGLPTDQALVETFLRARRCGQFAEGMWLTSAEEDLFERRTEEVFDHAEIVRHYGEEHAPEAWAGLSLVHEGDGVIEVAFAADGPRHLARLATLFPRPDALRVREVLYSARELEVLVERLDRDSAALADHGIDVHSIEINDDYLVEVGIVARNLADAELVLNDRYGSGVVASHLGVESTQSTSVEWTTYSLAEDERTLTIYYTTFAAYSFERVALEESDHQVRVTVFERAPVGAIDLIGNQRTASITLSGPLEEREVIDGNSEWPRPRHRSGA